MTNYSCVSVDSGYYRRQHYSTIFRVLLGFAFLVFLTRAIVMPTPTQYRDHLTDKCVAIELAGEYYACVDPRFEGKNMESIPIESGLNIADLRRMSRSKKK